MRPTVSSGRAGQTRLAHQGSEPPHTPCCSNDSSYFWQYLNLTSLLEIPQCKSFPLQYFLYFGSEPVCQGDQASMNKLPDLSIHFNNLLWNWISPHPVVSLPDSMETPKHMQLSWANLSLSECEWKWEKKLCFYCGEPKHVVPHCPAKHKTSMPSLMAKRTPEPSSVASVSVFKILFCQSFMFDVQIKLSESAYTCIISVLLNSGATGNFINHDTVWHLQNPRNHSSFPWISGPQMAVSLEMD